MKADLHMHSTVSDGMLEPRELVRAAWSVGVTHMALTDHDSVEGVADARDEAMCLGMTLISGVELSCVAGREVHILGYGVDPFDAALLGFCRERVFEREERASQMVQRLAEAGKLISLERVRQLAHGAMGRPHVARALVEAGYAASVDEAFARYLVSGRCGYVPKREIKVAQAVQMIRRAGGVAVLAHPMEMKVGEMALEALVREWKSQGMEGMEVYHPSAANHQAARLLALARREGLLVTGGSDFHGEKVRNTPIGEGVERWQTVGEDMRLLLKRLDERPAYE